MIYRLQPNRVRRSYLGGKRIEAFTNTPPEKQHPLEALLSEDWTASVTKAFHGAEEIEGEGLGRTEDGRLVRDIVGDELKILVKLLDAAERLVVQAHPTVPFAKANCHCDFGKTECWYFLDCGPDACVYLGFQKGVTRKDWEAVFESQDIPRMLSMLHRVPVKTGDFVFVDGGVPHAIGADCFMIELQEPSDLMVVSEKVTPSGRVLPEKKLHMGLGYEKMFEVYDYTGYEEEELKKRFCPAPRNLGNGVWEILGPDLTDKFRMLRLNGNAQIAPGKRFSVAIVTQGEGECCGLAVKKGDRLLVEEKMITTRGPENFTVVLCV